MSVTIVFHLVSKGFMRVTIVFHLDRQGVYECDDRISFG